MPQEATAESEQVAGVHLRHESDRVSIHISIYNTNSNANEASEAGQIVDKCAQNANQDGQTVGADCGDSPDDA